jgi:SAM-dependent methyltransferase
LEFGLSSPPLSLARRSPRGPQQALELSSDHPAYPRYFYVNLPVVKGQSTAWKTPTSQASIFGGGPEEQSMPKEWWENFFSGIVLDLWKEVYDEPHTRAEADFILKTLKVPNGATLLDVPCGEGRLARELASRGYALTGVDFSSDFLQEARSRAMEKGLDIRWEQRDMRDLPWHHDFDGAFCFGGSFGYFEDEGNADFVRAVCRSLKEGARFVLEIGVSMETLLPRFQTREWTRIGDFLFL